MGPFLEDVPSENAVLGTPRSPNMPPSGHKMTTRMAILAQDASKKPKTRVFSRFLSIS